MKLKLLGLVALSLSCISATVAPIKNTEPSFDGYTVDFFNNYLREDVVLSNGTYAKGNNVLYKTVEVAPDALVSKPEDPLRARYEFQGWFKETDCENEWNFTTDRVTGNLRLFAKWGISQKQDDDEPEYIPPSTVLEESASTDYVIDSIMYSKVEYGQIKVTKSALLKLAANKDNVLPLMEYRVKASKTIAATYADNKITVTCNGNSQDILVKDASLEYRVDNSNYESKASKYEDNAVEEESYHVMLAGSSSIEFWTSSKEDLEPVVSYNHGIGGTTIEEWDEKLNQRLVYPYKPKMVVYYVGINNVINTSQTASEIWNNLKNFFDHTHEALPNTKVQYIMMNLIPGYTSKFDTINAVNANVVEYQKSNTWLTLINPGTALLKENGEPNAAYFRTDGLHLSYYGYVVWGAIIKESIVEGLKAN